MEFLLVGHELKLAKSLKSSIEVSPHLKVNVAHTSSAPASSGANSLQLQLTVLLAPAHQQFQHRGGGGGHRGHSGREGGGRHGRGGFFTPRSNVVCQVCTKPGHSGFFCYHRFYQNYSYPSPSRPFP